MDLFLGLYLGLCLGLCLGSLLEEYMGLCMNFHSIVSQIIMSKKKEERDQEDSLPRWNIDWKDLFLQLFHKYWGYKGAKGYINVYHFGLPNTYFGK